MTEQFYFSKVLRWADKGGLMRMGVIQIKHGASDLPPLTRFQLNIPWTNLEHAEKFKFPREGLPDMYTHDITHVSLFTRVMSPLSDINS